MDKSWIQLCDRTSADFRRGLESFLEFSYTNRTADSKIKCPCVDCRNSRLKTRSEVLDDVICNGFLPGYTNWVHQGEQPNYLRRHLAAVTASSDQEANRDGYHDDMKGLLHDTFVSSLHDFDADKNANTPGETHVPDEHFDKNTEKFFNILKHAEVELFPGCESFTFLSFIVRLLHVKSLCQWSNNSFTMLLEVLKEAFQHIEMFPSSYREAWKVVKDLGLDYEKIHACPNDCMLYWKKTETEKDEECKHCKTPRYLPFDDEDNSTSKRKSKIPAKVVRYFPLKPRLQRLFMSSKTAPLMRWHAEGRIDDGKLRHPADSIAWKSFDEKFPKFASDSRNVRLGLAADGFNPFKSMSTTHSTWPIILIPYNLPPGKCMKQTSIIVSTLIDGPKGPGNDIDIYLQPLIDELQELWDKGVRTYDAVSQSMFTLHARLIWTINDLPALAIMSGWSTKGKYACPNCKSNCKSRWLTHGKKHCYMWHNRFLENGDSKPKRLSGSEVLEQLDGMENDFGKYERPKVGRKRKQKADESTSSSVCRYNWKKVSIFFQLPYWKENLVPHNLDIMHIEKNVLENILWTLLGISGKTKDNYASRLDLQEMGIRKSLHPPVDGGPLPPSDTTLSRDQKDIFLKVLKNIKVPDGYSSNISKCIQLETRNIYGLKSHDCHILMQELLPIALRRSAPKHVCKAIIGLCDIFKQLYSKVHSASDFEALENRVAKVLCKLEKIFPPSFFDVMEHLPVHLPEEAKLAGPVQPRSMYPIERYLCTLKKYVRSKSHPEGSIAEGYLAEECMNFCALYLTDVETKFNRPNRNDEGDASTPTQEGRPLGKEERRKLDGIEWIQAHRYVLNNLSIVDKFKRKHLRELKRTNRRLEAFEIEKLQSETFHEWFRSHVRQTCENAGSGKVIDRDIQLLAAGPSQWARQYTGYVINGLRFHTKKRENRRKTQNSGVFSSSGDMLFYGVLQDIIELRYSNDLKFVMFKCDWVDFNTGLKVDEFNFTLVNFNRLLYRQNRNVDEPFILASQVKQQAWYVQDPIEPDWHVAMKMTPRSLFNVDPEFNEFENNEVEELFNLEEEEGEEVGNADINEVEVENVAGPSNADDATFEDEIDYFSSEKDLSSDDDNIFDNITSSSENESD